MMLKRYFEIKPSLLHLDVEVLVDLLPNLREDKELEKMNDYFHNLIA